MPLGAKGFLTVNPNATTTGGDTYSDYGHRHTISMYPNVYQPNRTFGAGSFLPRYVYLPVGGNRMTADMYNDLLTNDTRTRAHLRRHIGALGDRNFQSELAIGSEWNINTACIYRLQDRYQMELGHVQEQWGTQYLTPFNATGTYADGVTPHYFTVQGNVHLDGVSPTTHEVRAYDNTATADAGTVKTSFLNEYYASLTDEELQERIDMGHGVYNSWLITGGGTSQDDISEDAIVLNPTVFDAMDAGDMYTDRLDLITWLRYDLRTDEYVPNSEVIAEFPVYNPLNAREELGVGYFSLGGDTFVITKIGPQWLVRTSMSIHIARPNFSQVLRLDASNTGTFRFNTAFPDAASDNTFVRYCRYLRPSNLNNPLTIHRGYQVVVCADDIDRFTIYSPFVGDRPRMPLVYGDRVVTELVDPFHALGSAADGSTLNLVQSMSHEGATTIDRVRRVEKRAEPGVDPQHFFVDRKRADFDYSISTGDGIAYRYSVGTNTQVFTSDAFTTINGVENAVIPIELGFIALDLHNLTGRFPHVEFRFESSN
jgi:hypothetical protein